MWVFDIIKNIKQRTKRRHIGMTEEEILSYLEEESRDISNSSQNTPYRLTEEEILAYLEEERNTRANPFKNNK